MIEAIIVGSVVAFLALLFLLISYLAYRRAFHSTPDPNADFYRVPSDDQYGPYRERMISLIGKLDNTPYESVSIVSYDGLVLHARYYHVADGAPIHIKCHGYRSAGVRDICAGCQIANDLGHNSLVIDQRAHTKSQGKVISFGINERYDCLSWVNYLIDRFGKDTKIILAGVSMGAATVLMASGLDLPENVVCVFADCPYSSPWGIIKKVCGDMGLPKKLCFPFAWTAARLFGKFDLLECSAISEVKKSRVPILIIHGEDDRFVPCEMSREIAKSNPDAVTLVTIPDAGHVLCYFVQSDYYHKVTCEFIKKCLLKSQNTGKESQ